MKKKIRTLQETFCKVRERFNSGQHSGATIEKAKQYVGVVPAMINNIDAILKDRLKYAEKLPESNFTKK